MKKRSLAGLFFSLLLPLYCQAQTPVLTLGPEINISASAGLSATQNEYQCDLRCDPFDPLQMVITCKSPNESSTMSLYSFNGGTTWAESTLLANSGDPDCVYTQAGEPIWSFNNQSINVLSAQTSTTGGATWNAPQTIDTNNTKDDHSQSICDRTTSAYTGSIYVAGNNDNSQGFDICYSRNNGQTFATTHITWAKSLYEDLRQGFAFKPAVLTDGTLILSLTTAQTIITESNGDFGGATQGIYSVRSHNGGATFDTPVFISSLNQPATVGPGGDTELGGFAVGPWNGGQRIYLTFSPCVAPPAASTLMLTTSDDGGTTWSTPQAIAPNTVTNFGAGSSSVMVNANGVVGVQYYITNGNDNAFYNYFIASSDGGATFSTPVRVSSAESDAPTTEPRTPGDDQVYADASVDGNFQLVWTGAYNDATAYQLYHRTVYVNYPIGAVNTSGTYQGLLSNSDTLVSPPVTRTPVYNGSIASVSGSVVTVNGTPGWTANQFVYVSGTQTNTYYALIGAGSGTTNPKQGFIYPVTANGTNTLTLNLGSDSISSIPANSLITIIPYWTLSTLFPNAQATVSFTPTTTTRTLETEILIPNYSGTGTNLGYAKTYYYINSGSNVGWRLFGDATTTNHGDDILIPNGYFTVRNANNAPTLPLMVAGSMLTAEVTTPLYTLTSGPQDNAVAMVSPVAVSLNNCGLTPSNGSFVATTSTRSIQDELLIYNNASVGENKSPSATYYYMNGAWRLYGDATTTDHGSDLIPSGSALTIRKAATATGATSYWVYTPTY